MRISDKAINDTREIAKKLKELGPSTILVANDINLSLLIKLLKDKGVLTETDIKKLRDDSAMLTFLIKTVGKE